MEYDITNVVITLLIGIGIGLGLVALYVWHVFARFEKELQSRIRTAVHEVEQVFSQAAERVGCG